MSAITVSSQEAGKTCPYCRFPLKSGGLAERCDGCATIHHEECWRDGNGCAVLGCRMAGTASTGGVGVVAPGSPTSDTPPMPVSFSTRPPPISSGNRSLLIGLAAGLLIAGAGTFIATRSTKSSSSTPVARAGEYGFPDSSTRKSKRELRPDLLDRRASWDHL